VKKILSIVLICLFTVMFTVTAFATQSTTNQNTTVSQDASGQPDSSVISMPSPNQIQQGVDSQAQNNQQDNNSLMEAIDNMINKENCSLIERIVAGAIGHTIVGAVNFINRLCDFKDYGQLLFNAGVKDFLPPFTDNEVKTMNTWYQYMTIIYGTLVFITVVVLAIQLITTGMNPKMRETAKGTGMRLFVTILIVALAPLFFRILVFVNNQLVQLMLNLAGGGTSKLSDLTVEKAISNMMSNGSGSAIMDVLVLIMFAYLQIKLNLLFIVRKFSMIIFFIFTPISAFMWSLDKNVNAFGVWIGELLSNIFMQFFYALVFMVYIALLAGQNWMVSIIYALVLMPVGEALRNSVQGYLARLSGINENKIANTALEMFGLAGLAHTGSTIAAQFKPLKASGNSFNVGGMTSNSGSVVNPSKGASLTGNGVVAQPQNTYNTGLPFSIESTVPHPKTTNVNSSSANSSESAGTIIGSNNTADGSGVAAGAIINSLNKGSKAGYYTHRVADAMLKPIGALGNGLTGTNVPYNMAQKAAYVTGSAVKFATGTASTLMSAKKYAKENNISYNEALKQMTNAKSGKQAIGRVMSLNISNSFSSPNRVSQKLSNYGISSVNTSIDGIRYR
jgi:uncharacterized protein YxeA